MTRWSTLWLLLALAFVSCGGPAAPWTTAPATGLDLKLARSADEVALLEPLQLTLDLFVASGLDVAFARRRRSTPRRGAPRWWRPPPRNCSAASGVAPCSSCGRGVVRGHWCCRRSAPRPRTTRWRRPRPSRPCRCVRRSRPSRRRRPSRRTGGRRARLRRAVRATVDWRPAALGGGGALLLLVLLGLWFRPRRRMMAGEVALPPHVRALRELQRLRDGARATEARSRRSTSAPRRCCATTSKSASAARPRAHDRGVPARPRGGDALATAHRAELERFLRQCDLVKFAGVRPGEVEHLATWQLAAAFVEATRVDRVVSSPTAPAASPKPPAPPVPEVVR